MLFLIDENLPFSIGYSFQKKGHEIIHAGKIQELRGKSDEVLFDYAVKNRAIIITRDLDFSNPTTFDLIKISGMVVV